MPMEVAMTKWLGGTRGALLIVVLWVVGWGVGFGGLAELLVDPDGETLDMWPAEMAIPGFIGGIIFAIFVRASEGKRRFDAVPLMRFTLWGAVTGAILAVLSIASDGPIPLDVSAAEMIGVGTGLSAVAGFGTGIFFRLVTGNLTLGLPSRTT